MNSMPQPPSTFDEEFFQWLDKMSDELMICFASPGCLTVEEIQELQQKTGFPLPQDIVRFYEHYDPWGSVNHQRGWELLKRRLDASGMSDLVVPIDCGSQSADGYDTVAMIQGPDKYKIIVRSRATGATTIFEGDLRAYFISGVQDEIHGSE